MELSTLLTSKKSIMISSGQGETLCTSENCILAASTLLQSMNTKIQPCDDFYQYACGNWAKYHARRDFEKSLSWFHEINVDISQFIPKFLESKTTLKEPKIIKEIRKMYKACMQSDENEIYQNSFLDTLINKMFRKDFDLIDTIALVKKVLGVDIFFKFDIVADPRNRTFNIIKIDKPTSFGREQYGHQTIVDSLSAADPTFKMALNATIHVIAQDIIMTRNFLKELANKAITNFAYADKDGNDREPNDDFYYDDDVDSFVSIGDLQNFTDTHIAPNKFLIWSKYIKTIYRDVYDLRSVDLSEELILLSHSGYYYLLHLIDYFRTPKKYELQLYILWTVIEEMLSNSFNRKTNKEDEETKGKLSRCCASYVNKEMEMAVNYAYAESKAFDQIKSNVTIMLDFIRAAFNESVQDNEWMDDKSKLFALEKANAMKTFIGFPEWLKADGKLDEYFGDLRFDKSNHFKNLIVARKWQMNKTLKKFDATMETEWVATPKEVNAFYSLGTNAMTIPLTILQFPFYNLGLEALNYGASGSTIGQEFTHGFAGRGLQYDEYGRKRRGWTHDTLEDFNIKSECFIKQYNGYHLSEINENVKGNLTLGENIADAGGVRQAYHAYKAYISKYGREKRLLGFESFSHERLFFLSYANSLCETQTKSNLKKRQVEDTHSPGRFRVNGVLENSKEFKNAFECSASSKMVSRDPCRIW